MLPTVSVIVPIYNAEAYLSKCIDSILQQSYSDFELILVDDESPDNSYDIMKKYEQKDNRIHSFRKRNGGASSARNFGLSAAKGKWVVFVDSDDFVNDRYIEDLVCKMEPISLVVQGISKIVGDRIVENLVFEDNNFTVSDFKTLLNDKTFFDRGFPVAKVFDKSIIDKHNLKFNENIHYSEDLIFMLEYIQYVSKIRFIQGSNYYYQIAVSNLSQRYNSFESEYNLYEEFDLITKKLALNIGMEQTDATKELAALMLMRSIYAMYINKEFESRQIYNRVKKIRSKKKNFVRCYYNPKIAILKLIKKTFLLNIGLFHRFCLLKFSRYANR